MTTSNRIFLVPALASLALATACTHRPMVGGPPSVAHAAAPSDLADPPPVQVASAGFSATSPEGAAVMQPPPAPEPSAAPVADVVAAAAPALGGDGDEIPIDRPMDHALAYHTVLKLTRPGTLHLDLQGPLTPPSPGLCRSQHTGHPDIVAVNHRMVIHMIPAPLENNVPAESCTNAEWMDAHVDQPLPAGEWAVDSDTWFGEISVTPAPLPPAPAPVARPVP